MDFDALFAQVLEALQREQRISYRALRRRFELSDDDLEDLKIELIEAKQLAVDENDRILVWRGGVGETSVSASQPNQTTQPAAQEEPPTQVASPPSEPHTPDAERRQLTVMFCDLVGSTELSSQLDPEDYREVVREYQKACTEVIERFDGYVAQYLGDGLLVYFGYPQSHEDEAQRAVHTGLGLLNGMKQLNARFEQDKAIRLGLRVGIHTGLVVIGDIGEGSRQEQLALGEVPNVAARIQGLAEPDTVVISDATYCLIQGYFDCESLGKRGLRGVAEPIVVYQVVRASGVQSRLDMVLALTPLVGREPEIKLLLDRWTQAQAGQGQVVVMSGEAGIGKSRLVQAMKEHVAEGRHTRLECRSSPYYQNTALYPIIDLVERGAGFHRDDPSHIKLEKLEQALSQYQLPLKETVPLFTALLSLPVPENRYSPINLSPQQQRQKTLETTVGLLLELAEQHPLLFIVEDLHWTDPTTLEFLDLLLDQTPTTSMLILLTCRPEFQATWSQRSYLTGVTINRLAGSYVEQIVERLTDGQPLPAEVIQQIVDKTDGVPLFVEEITKSVLESGVLKVQNGQYELVGSLSALAIPNTLQDSLMARLDRLMPAKVIAQLGATIGRQFSYELLYAVSQLDEPTLQRELGRLVKAELLYQRGIPPQAIYTFKHALIQEAAYQSFLRRTRQQYHRQVAQVLEGRFPEVVDTQPELVAYHYSEGQCPEQALVYWQRAGQRAFERSAHAEAIVHLRQGLTLLRALPEMPERLQQELDLQVPLGQSLLSIQGMGHPEVKQAYDRAQELCQQLGETPQLFPILRGLFMHYATQGQLHTAHKLGEQLMHLAKAQSDPGPLMLAHYLLGQVLFYLGELVLAQSHHAKALTLYNSLANPIPAARYGVDIGVCSHGWLARDLWYLGYPDQSLKHSQAALALGQEVSHPFSLTFALLCSAILYHDRREVSVCQEQAANVMRLSTEHGFSQWLALGRTLHGGASAMQRQGEQGIAEIRQGLAVVQLVSVKNFQPYSLCLLAEAYGAIGHPKEGLRPLAEAIEIMDTIELRIYGAELYRLKGTLLLKQAAPDAAQAETCFYEALNIARQQQAKSWELRAATSLARLWQSQNKRKEAYELLSPVYGWFTEGFDTVDLQDAKSLLDDLS